jgi:adenylosuccinate lyase
VSRLQRDLSDSTVLRSLGVPLAHTLIALKSTSKGLSKLLLNADKINQDLEENWAVVSEAIQTILRREGFQKPYELLKSLTRTNQAMDKDTVHAFISTLDVEEQIKQELWRITPQNYTGIQLVKN